MTAEPECDVSRVVVTGAARGIGRALAKRFAAAGWSVVVNDVDAGAVQAVADEIGGHAVACDAASQSGVEQLIAASTSILDDIDMYVANAGIAQGLALEASDETWARCVEVNVMGHVRAARLLVPGWIERGHGRFVSTASAAGLLTSLGSAPYSVTKHGAVAFAEWLSATYRHLGLHVHAICPQGVTTRMLDDAGAVAEVLLARGACAPDDVADALMRAIEEDRFLVLPHPEVADYYRARATDTDQWLSAMNRLQQKLEERTR